MKRLLMLLIILVGVFVSPTVQAQEGDKGCSKEEVAAVLQSAASDLQAAQGLDTSQALDKALEISARLEALNNKCNASGATGERMNPIPLGEYYSFDKGRVRIAAVEDPYSHPDNIVGLDPGMRAIAVSLEYICENADPNQSCNALDVILSGIVLVGGMVIDRPFLMTIEKLQPEWSGQEAFAGNTLTGVDYLALPDSAQIESIKVMIGFKEFYFSTTAKPVG